MGGVRLHPGEQRRDEASEISPGLQRGRALAGLRGRDPKGAIELEQLVGADPENVPEHAANLSRLPGGGVEVKVESRAMPEHPVDQGGHEPAVAWIERRASL